MKGGFLVVTSSHNRTVYLPLSRFLRIETNPPSQAAGVTIVFEDYKVFLHATPDTVAKVAQNVYELLLQAHDRDLVHLRPNEQGAKDITVD